MAGMNEILRKLRLSEKLTQEEMGNKLGVSRSSISMYENGDREPPKETLEAYADYFNVDMNYLYGMQSQPLANPIVEPRRKYLMDKLSKATPEQLRKLDKLWDIIVEEDDQNN